ncbi:MAG: PKD domain-containing protein [Chloroflexota bacterium]|nr:MAG: PKD domain-containing protein [Chloroflexota bacterium]
MASCTSESTLVLISPPTAEFAAVPEEGPAPLATTFTDLSKGDISRWHWDFGDGQFSDESETSHTYITAGDYTVSLAVMGPGGSDVETKIEYIKVSNGVISWEEAGNYIGQHKVVEGIVVGTHYAADIKSQPTFLDFHKPYQGYFKCIIWGRDRQKFIEEFPPDPETHFLNERVQVNGLIEEYPKGSGIPEIVLRDPSQITVIVEQLTP